MNLFSVSFGKSWLHINKYQYGFHFDVVLCTTEVVDFHEIPISYHLTVSAFV
jgi:hypothetical protein